MPCRAVRAVRKRLGRRGAFLLTIGVGKIFWGLGMIVDPPSPLGLRLLTDMAPLHCWAWLWVLAGTVTAGSAFVQVGRDWGGYVAALVPPSVWATAYLAAAINGQFSRGVWVALWYLTSHVGVIVWAAGVPEHSLAPAPRRARKAEGG